MKKIIKVIVLGLVILIAILGIGTIIFLTTFDFNRFKPQIIAAGQNALGRSLDLGRINLKLSFKEGVRLSVTDIAIGENPDFGKENFLTAKEVNFGVSIKDLIFKRKVRILEAVCEAPQISIIRLKDGRINAQTLGARTTSQKSSKEISPSEAAMGLPALFVSSINLNNGKLTYTDYSFAPKIHLALDKIAVKIEKFSLNDYFPVSFQAALANDNQNISAQGNGKLDIGRLSFSLKDVKGAADLATLSMDQLRKSIPQLKEVSLPEIKSGVLSVSIDIFEVGPKGLMALRGQGTLTRGSLKMKELAVPIDAINAGFTVNESTITLKNASLSLGKGKVEASGDVISYIRTQNYSLKAGLKDFDLSECLKQSGYPIKVKGLVLGSLDLKGRGFNPDTVLENLSGTGSMEMKEGQLTDINVLKMVLDKLSFVPDLTAKLESALSDKFKEKLSKKDTDITAFNAALVVSNGSLVIQQINAETDTFIFQGNGTAGFDRSYSLDGSLMIPRELSTEIVEAVPEMEYLQDASRRIWFPLRIEGKGSSVSFMPDVSQLGMNMLKQKGSQELGKVLNKVLGGDSTVQRSGQ